MTIPDPVRLAAIREVERFCEQRVRPVARDQLRLEFLVRGNSINIVERRAPWRPEYGPEWSSLEIAQLRYDQAMDTWSLYSRHTSERWLRCSEVVASRDVAPLIAEVDTDPTGIFWG